MNHPPAPPPAPRPLPRPRAQHETPPPSPRPPRRRRGTPVVPIIIGIVVLALLAGGGVVLWRMLQPAEVTDAPVGPATRASDAVAGYLHALADGDLDTALSYGQSEPTDRTFITQEVLDHSRRVAPIGNIAVREVTDPNAYEVHATYTIGEQEVDSTFGVIHDGEKWLLLDTTGHLSVGDLRQKNLPIVINGVPAGNSNELTVLPGGYTFDTGLTRIGYGDQVTTVSAPGSRQTAPNLSPVLTAQGHDDLVAAARVSLDECLASAEMNPPGCPFGARVPDGSTAEEVTWQLVGDPFADVQATLEWTDHGVVQLPVQVRVVLTARVRTGTSTGTTVEEFTRNSTVRADVLDEPLRVSWHS